MGGSGRPAGEGPGSGGAVRRGAAAPGEDGWGGGRRGPAGRVSGVGLGEWGDLALGAGRGAGSPRPPEEGRTGFCTRSTPGHPALNGIGDAPRASGAGGKGQVPFPGTEPGRRGRGPRAAAAGGFGRGRRGAAARGARVSARLPWRRREGWGGGGSRKGGQRWAPRRWAGPRLHPSPPVGALGLGARRRHALRLRPPCARPRSRGRTAAPERP